MPDLIQFKNDCQIKNTYSADGQKLSSRYVTVAEGVYQPLNPGQVIENLDVNENDNVTVDGTDYVGNIEYQVDRYFDWDLTYEPVEQKYLYRVHNPEGYVNTFVLGSSYGPVYNYYRKDHLGNNREVWNASYKWGSTTRPEATSQITQYYPSGLPWASNAGDNPGSQPYKYNGKEFVEMHGLDEYDSEARWYYPAIMRTTTMDPLAEKFYDVSPYAWCENNPVNRIDPDGKFVFAIPVIIEGAVYVSTVIAAAYYGAKTVREIKEIVDQNRVDNAKVSNNHGAREQKRRDERSRQENVKIAKKHNEMINSSVPSPQPDGSSGPKKPIGEWKVGTVVVVGVAIGKDLHNNIVKPQPTKPGSNTPQPTKPDSNKPKPKKIEDIKPKDRK